MSLINHSDAKQSANVLGQPRSSMGVGNDWTSDQLEDAVRHARIDRSSISTHLTEQAMAQMTIIPNEQGALAPIVDLRPSVRLQPTATLHALQEWEGYVIEIGPQEFRAHLIDLTAGLPHEQEEATIPLAEVSDRDAKRMVVGSIFRWVIGYERSPAGTKRRVSQIVFRDLPAVTEKDLQEGRSWAQDLMQAFAP